MSLSRFDELYERYCDGGLSADERRAFVVLLEDPACRARFAEFASYEATVSEELRVTEAAVSESKPSSRTLPKVGSRRIPIQRSPVDDEGRSLSRIGLAAAAVIGIILLLIFATSSTRESSGPVLVRPKSAQPLPVVQAPEPVLSPRVETPAPPLPPPEKVQLVPREFDPVPVPRETPVERPVAPSSETAKPPVKPASRPEEPASRDSATFIATLDRVLGDVRLGASAAEEGKGISSGQSLATGKSGYALLRFPDGTRFELGSETVVVRCSDGPSGKSVQLDQGMLFVDAVKQPAGRPLVIVTAQAESTVMGTQFVLAAAPSFTRIDVREGRVKFTRLPQAVSSVMVNAGHYAVAGPGGDPAAKPGIAIWKAPPSGLQLWLRADMGVKLNGSAVSAWMDQSSTGIAAVQTTAAAQPAFVANALAGRPALRFDGTDDAFSLPEGFSDFRAGLTAFVVLRPAAGGAWSRFIDLDVGPACDNIVFGRKDTPDKLGFWVYSNSSTKGKVEAPGTVVADQVQSFSVVLNPSGRVTLYRNGIAVAAGETSVPRSILRKPNSLAKSNSGAGDAAFKGDFFELLLYNRALSDGERAYIESYLNAKYFDVTTPPASLRPADK